MARTLNNTGMAGRLRQIQEQQQGNGGGEGQPQPQQNAPQLNATAMKNRRVTMGRTPTPPPAPQPIRLGDYQATTSATDPRNIVQLQPQQNELQARLQASIPSVTAPRSYSPNQAQGSGASWVDMSAEQRASILSNPDFYKNNEITKYDAATQQQILADPSFNWDNLPKWQRWYYSLSSNPAAMGAVQGLVMGAGNPGGAILGGTLGWASSVLGYDPNKEFWQQGDSKFTFDANQAQEAARGAFGLLNWGAEQVEKGIGLSVQAAGAIANPEKYGTLKDVFTKEGWNAGSVVFENLSQNISGAQQVLLGAIKSNDPIGYIEELHANAPKGSVLEKALLGAIGYVSLPSDIMLGAKDRVVVDDSNFLQRMADIRNQIKDGQNYREVMSQMQSGILAQVGDMAGQGLADPLNFVGQAEAKAGEVTARISGDKIAETAFSQSEGFFDAQKRIQNIVNTPGEALKIDPNYKVNEMGWITKALADLTPDGKIKGGLLPSSGALLDYTPPKKNLLGFIENMTSLTPESRARVGQDLLVRNLGSIMASYFGGTDVKGFSEWWKSFSNGDMAQSAELSNAMAQSPEFYTVLPAAKDFDINGQLALWEQSEPARMAVSRIADVLGENPTTFIEDLTKRGTGPEDFARVTERLKQTNTPEARALLGEIEAGRFTATELTNAVKAFSDGSVPFHPGQWMAETLDAIKSHYDNWAVDHFKLEEEAQKTLFRVSSVLKSAQSILLLGANPGYFISNVLPTMVTRAASGVYGYMTPTAIDSFFGRMGFSLEEGFSPSRLDEGVGPSGMIDQTRQSGDAIREATLGKGTLTDIQRALGKIGSAMPFNKLSRLLEGYEGKQAYAMGIKKFWGESWHRGEGFREIPKALLTEMTNAVGPRAGEILYAQIEAGMSKAEIMSIVNEHSAQIQSRGLVYEAAQSLNIPASKAASMLEHMGVLDQLDANLKNADTQGRIEAAFKKARETAQAAIDQQASRDAIARIEHITNRIQTEGPKAITDIAIDMENKGNDIWIQHYDRMGELAEVVEGIANPDARRKMYAIKYAESREQYRRFNAERGSTYLGILKAVGLESGETGRALLANLAELDRINDNAYRVTNDLRDQHFSKWNTDDWSNPRRQVEYDSMESQIEKTWKETAKAEERNLKNFGELMGRQYEQMFGVEAGEAARQTWEQISAFRKEMVDRREAFRETQKQAKQSGVPRERRLAAAKEFWGKTYNYMVIEMGRIKQEAISNLDRIAKNGGGDQSRGGAGIDPNNPQGGAPTINPEMEALRQQAQERASIQKEKISAAWDIAEQYSKKLANNSSNFDRGYQYDKMHLEATLRKEEYGGDPTIKNLTDAVEKLTPEQIKQILDNRENVKANEAEAYAKAQAERLQQEMTDAARRASNRKTAENLTILQNIRKRGGIDIASWLNFGDKPEGYQPGVFSREGKNRWSLDMMAKLLADDGYPIDMNDPADVGGINQLVDLVQRARAGEEIFPAGHEFIIDEAVNKAQADYIERIAAENTFDADQWLVDTLNASEGSDRVAFDNLIENLPDEMLDQNITAQETYREYAERVSTELDAKIARDAEAMSIAENQVRAEAAVRQQEATANTSMTRQLFRERLQEAFGLNEDMTDTVVNITDARAESWAAMGNGTADDWYASRIADVVKDGNTIDLAAKGGVQFLDDGRAIIRAFEKADVYTAVHELSHIFFNDLPAEEYSVIKSWTNVTKKINTDIWRTEAGNFTIRETGTEFIYKDVTGAERTFDTFEQAKRVLEQEAFARGFEKYLADGDAPTPKLRTVFGKFKEWVSRIYGAITGSPIDINLEARVKDVFDSLLVGPTKSADVGDILTQLGYDKKTFTTKNGKIVRIQDMDLGERTVRQDTRGTQADAVINALQSKLNAMKRGEPVRVGQAVDQSVPTPPKNTSAWMMTYDEYKASILQEQRDFASRRIEQIQRGELRDNPNIDPTKELAKMEAILKRDTISYDMFGDARESYRKQIEKALIDEKPVPNEIKQAYYAMGKEGNLSQAEYRNLQQAGRGQVQADPRMPLGGYEEAAGWLAQSQVMDEGWTTEVQPLLDKMQEAAKRRLTEPQIDGAFKDLSPEGQAMLQQYLNGVTNDMASTKMAAQRWGAMKRDDVSLNYNKRYGFDKMLDVVYPYQFFYTRSMMTWAQRALDHPAWLSNYARIRRQQDRYENNLPERMRGKMRIDAPWLPDWMGDGLYIDPLSVLFTPHNFLRPFEQMSKDRNMQVIEAERILQEWAADGVVPQDQIAQAAQQRSGSTWERALAEAKLRREAEISNPMDFVSTMFGPAWYLTTPAKLLNIGKDGPQTLTELPLTRTARAVDTVTDNTWAEPIGNIIGLLAKPEEAFREAANLPKFGEYGDYYTDRAIANMVAEGRITSEDAQIAMIERKGDIFDEAQQRVKMELAMRVPLSGILYAGLNEGIAAAAQAAVPSLFGAGILPEGELKFRGLKQEWNEAWAKRDAGDTQAINRFFEKHPEYEAYLAKGKEPQDRLKTFLIGQIWDGYMALGETDRKQATADMGDLFKQAFINPETRAYDTLDIDTLTQWAQMVNKRVPNVEQTAPAIANPRKVNYMPQDVTAVTDQFFSQRKRLYGDYYELEQGYYNLPKSERASYLVANPQLKNYWEWKDGWFQRYPDLVPVFKGQVFKRIDTTNWPIGLEDYVSAYALGGERLPNGAYKAMQQVWINEGYPMGDFDTWLKSQVVPAMMYQEGAQMQP